MPDYINSPGFLYLEATRHNRDTIFEKGREKISSRETFKVYPDAKRIKLPEPSTPAADIWRCLLERRSVRNYSSGHIQAEFLSSLLWAAQGITAKAGRYLLRTAPSAGALYPIETYVCINSCDSLKAGLYHYEVSSGLLELLKAGSFGESLSASAFGQTMCQKAPVVFIWSAIPRRTMAKYGSRGIRYIFMDVAHICENLLLTAHALELEACPIGAFFDDEVNDLLGLDGIEETVIYMASVGHPVK
jgi:SagB-type dehydrogenase family enzyme